MNDELIDQIVKQTKQQIYSTLKDIYNMYSILHGILENHLPTTVIRDAKRDLKKQINITADAKTLSDSTYNLLYNEGMSGLKLHKLLKNNKELAVKLDDKILDINIKKYKERIISKIDHLLNTVAKTGFIDPIEIEEPKKESETFQELINQLTNLIQDEDPIIKYMSQGVMSKVIKLKISNKEEYQELIDNDCELFKLMIKRITDNKQDVVD